MTQHGEKGGAQQPFGRQPHHFGQSRVTEEDGSFLGERSCALVHAFGQNAVGLFRTLQRKDSVAQWPIDHDGIHIAVADGFHRRFRLSQAIFHPFQFRVHVPSCGFFHGCGSAVTSLRFKFSPKSTFLRSDKSPMIRRKGKGNCLIRVGTATICSSFAKAGFW